LSKENVLLEKQKEARLEAIGWKLFLNPLPILNYLIDKDKHD
jgi:hypothetical protein